MSVDLKAATPDTTIPATGAFLFGADSQAAAAPSVYRIDTTVLAYLDSLAHTITVNGALSAPATSYTGTWITGGSATTTKPHFLIEPTGTTSTGWSTSGTGLGVNAATGFTGNLFDFQLAGTSKIKADTAGIVTVASNGGIITSSGGMILAGATALFGVTSVAGNDVVNISSSGVSMNSSGGVRWTNVAYANTSPDLILARDAANTLAQRNGTTAQKDRVYNTYTDASNGEWWTVDWATTANTVSIGTAAAGTGTVRNIAFIGGNVTFASTTATPAAGSTAARILFGTTAGFGIYYGSGAPTVSAAQGSLYLRSDGSSTSTRMYVNNSAGSGTTWTAVTTAA